MKRIAVLLLSLLLALPPAACARAEAGGNKLTLGAMPSIDIIPFVVAQREDYFKRYGVDFHLEVFKSTKDRDAAFEAGALDGMCCDEVAVCIFQNAGTDLRITGMTQGEYVLVAGKGSGITSIADLKGRSVAISEKTLIEYTLDRMLEKSGLKPADVSKAVVPAVPVRLEMLAAGKADAALLPEPYATFAADAGGIRLACATGIGLYPSVIAFPKATADARGADIAAMMEAYDDAVDYINRTPVSQYEDLVIEAAGYPEDMRGRIVLPAFEKGRMPSTAELEDAVRWAASRGLCAPSLDPAGFVMVVGQATP